MSKAQLILDKAKKASHTKSKAKQVKSKSLKTAPNKVTAKQEEEMKEVEEELISPPPRRSSRQSSMAARNAIAECLSVSSIGYSALFCTPTCFASTEYNFFFLAL